ncbi:Acetyl-CoA carboxylase 1 [Camellia lanceoleosa]|uniref:Acetyl-CoA carboxylase 1 n=1 Tax=Camellia lanceoleosa TaxID=1840588 RepID=A0ACC0FKX9_9ERIC|nr:Acetyl-CoA carboxylase 1 [Camellia lanceoleosa]
MRVRAERPPWYIFVVGGALYIDMVRGGPGSYRLKMNQSEIEAEKHTLRDRGLLMQASIYCLPFSSVFSDA